MEYYGKKKRVYRGIGIAFAALIGLPLALFVLFYWAIALHNSYPQEVIIYISMAFAGMAGFIFGITCLIAGFVHDIFIAMIDRIKDVCEFFDFGSKEAFAWYFNEFIHDGGIILWLFLLIMGGLLASSILGFSNFFNWYFSLA